MPTRRVESKLDPFKDLIVRKVALGLSATQVYQDLRELDGFDVSYVTVRRLVSALRPKEPQVYARLRFGPGEEEHQPDSSAFSRFR